MKEALDALNAARRIAIISHRDPDPDTMGSALALGLALDSVGKRVSLHCADPVPEQIRFLEGSERFVTEPPPADVDLIVTVDYGDISRAKFALPAGVPLLNVDHHASNNLFGTVNFVDPTSAASGEVVGRLIDGLGATWTPGMATAALVAIMTDTGSFQFPSTDRRCLERAAQLRAAGADLQAITYNVFRNKRFEALRLLGIALSRLEREDGGRLVWTWIGPDDLVASEAREEDATGLVEQVARSAGVRVALLFNRTNEGVKLSCRTSESAPSVDAAALMREFGGGGHVRAAGALVVQTGDLHDVQQRVLSAARRALDAARVA